MFYVILRYNLDEEQNKNMSYGPFDTEKEAWKYAYELLLNNSSEIQVYVSVEEEIE